MSKRPAEPRTSKHRRGFCVWLTGLSGAGKSTIAEVFIELLRDQRDRAILLDGDAIRKTLSPGLGFSPQDREIHIRRVAFMAEKIVRSGGIAVCALISPYRSARNQARQIVGNESFVEVFVDTPLAVCEQRDPKGLYRRARQGELNFFTGIDDPYQPPEAPELRLDTTTQTSEESAQFILKYLFSRGFLDSRFDS